MPNLYLDDVPSEVYDRLRQLAGAHNRTLEAEAVNLLQLGLGSVPSDRTPGEILAELRRHSFTPPPGTPESVDLLRKDRRR